LRDRNKVQKLVESVDPLVRAVDGIAGERVSMRVIFFTYVKSSAGLLWALSDKFFVSAG
jgi:hypothetical protein